MAAILLVAIYLILIGGIGTVECILLERRGGGKHWSWYQGNDNGAKQVG